MKIEDKEKLLDGLKRLESVCENLTNDARAVKHQEEIDDGEGAFCDYVVLVSESVRKSSREIAELLEEWGEYESMYFKDAMNQVLLEMLGGRV